MGSHDLCGYDYYVPGYDAWIIVGITMTPAEREQVRAALKEAVRLIDGPNGYSGMTFGMRESLAILDAKPAPVTDKEREEAACKFAARICENIDFENMRNTFHFVKDQYILIRKAAYEEGLRDGSKRE